MDDLKSRLMAILDKDLSDKDKFMTDCYVLREMGFGKELSEALEVLTFTYFTLNSLNEDMLNICEKELQRKG